MVGTSGNMPERFAMLQKAEKEAREIVVHPSVAADLHHSRDARWLSANIRISLAASHGHRQERAAQVQWLRKACEDYEWLASHSPEHSLMYFEWFQTSWGAADRDVASPYFPKAVFAGRKAAELYEEALRNDPSALRHRINLGLCYDLLAMCAFFARQYEEAEDWYRRSIRTRQQREEQEKESSDAAVLWATKDVNAAHSFRAIGADREALRRTHAALESLESKFAAAPRDANVARMLDHAHYEHGKALWTVGNHEEALASFRRSVLCRKIASELEPNDPEHRRRLSEQYARLAGWAAKAGFWDEADSCLSEIEKIRPLDSGFLRKRAGYWRENAERLDDARSLSETEQTTQRQRYLQMAQRLELLLNRVSKPDLAN
jgi:tetratricopeptide (TPR) repeat protein